MNLYLDSNAHIKMSDCALKAYTDFQNSVAGHGHPSSLSKSGQLAAAALEEARSKIKTLLGAEIESELVFTSTCSQACEWALHILTSHCIKTNPPRIMFYSPVEHSSVRDCIENYLINKYSSCNKISFSRMNVDHNGVIVGSPANYAVCIHIQNELGTIQPIQKLYGCRLLSDMCQSVGKVSINLSDMGVDMATFGGHKFGGSAGLGFIYIKDPSWWQEFGTGSRYLNDRPGTPDVGAAVATAAALDDILLNMPERTERSQAFQNTLEPRLQEMGLEIIGKGAPRVPGTTFVKLSKIALYVLLDLSNQGIMVGLGSACGAMNPGVPPVIKALGRSEDAHDFIRISQHGEYDSTDALYFVDQLNKSIRKLGDIT